MSRKRLRAVVTAALVTVGVCAFAAGAEAGNGRGPLPPRAAGSAPMPVAPSAPSSTATPTATPAAAPAATPARGGAAGGIPGTFGGLVVVGQSGGRGCGGSYAYPTITDGLDAVSAGGIVIVCPGTYAEDVVVTKPVTLIGFGATVQPDAEDSSPLSDLLGGNNAFTVLAPNVTIRGFTVQGATSDGIFVLGDHALVQGVTATNNAINGINVDGSSHSIIKGNTITQNGGGIELANDPEAAGISIPGSTGTATYDLIIGNHVYGNPQACAIYLVDHAGGGAEGIHNNVIQANTVTDNATEGFGAGVLLASPVPGGAVYDNTIAGNTITGNGLPGVALHSHVPGQNFSGNSVVGNTIGTNNILGLESDDAETTGVFVGSQDPLTITVSHNTITDNHYGIFTAGPSVTVTGTTTNTFQNVDVELGSSPTFE